MNEHEILCKIINGITQLKQVEPELARKITEFIHTPIVNPHERNKLLKYLSELDTLHVNVGSREWGHELLDALHVYALERL